VDPAKGPPAGITAGANMRIPANDAWSSDIANDWQAKYRERANKAEAIKQGLIARGVNTWKAHRLALDPINKQTQLSYNSGNGMAAPVSNRANTLARHPGLRNMI
jgi:hypothetical protein